MKKKTRSQRTTNRQPPATSGQLPPDAYDSAVRLSILLTDEQVYVARYERGAPAAAYPVAVGDIAQAFNIFGASTGLLPPNILFWQNQAGQNRLGIWMPPAKRTLQFNDRIKPITIPLPGFVFVGQGTSYNIWAVAQRPTRLSDMLYRTPLPNVYDKGGVCNGSVKFPKCSPETIVAASELFFESRFGEVINNHALQGVDNIIKFLRSLERKREFPVERLRAQTTMGRVIGGESSTATPDDYDEDDDEDEAMEELA